MTRGDQRDRDRAKNQAKQAQKIKSQGKEGNPMQRNANDAAALAAKVAKKEAMKKEQEATTSNSSTAKPITRKTITETKDNSLDDILNAGLKTNKKK